MVPLEPELVIDSGDYCGCKVVLPDNAASLQLSAFYLGVASSQQRKHTNSTHPHSSRVSQDSYPRVCIRGRWNLALERNKILSCCYVNSDCMICVFAALQSGVDTFVTIGIQLYFLSEWITKFQLINFRSLRFFLCTYFLKVHCSIFIFTNFQYLLFFLLHAHLVYKRIQFLSPSLHLSVSPSYADNKVKIFKLQLSLSAYCYLTPMLSFNISLAREEISVSFFTLFLAKDDIHIILNFISSKWWHPCHIALYICQGVSGLLIM